MRQEPDAWRWSAATRSVEAPGGPAAFLWDLQRAACHGVGWRRTWPRWRPERSIGRSRHPGIPTIPPEGGGGCRKGEAPKEPVLLLWTGVPNGLAAAFGAPAPFGFPPLGAPGGPGAGF